MSLSPGRLLSVLYAALGPPSLYVLYLFIRDHWGTSLSPRVDWIALIVLVATGSAGAYVGVSGNRRFRIGMALLSGCCTLAVTFFVAFTYECSRGNCL